MSSFSCPHLDESCGHCMRLRADCVPGRPGCVLRGSVFLVPAEERLRARDQDRPAAPEQPTARKRSGNQR